MATQYVLADVCQRYLQQSGVYVQIEFVGGVDAAKRVQAGEQFDMVLLAADAIDKLINSGHLVAGSRCDWVKSAIAVAVDADAPLPSMGSEAQLRDTVMAAASLCYSTGPSGTYLENLFKRWGVFEQLQSRILIAPPGTPVGLLVAQGKAALGFQQRSELVHQTVIQVIADLPAEVAHITSFSSGIGLAATEQALRLQAVRDFLQFLTSPAQDAVKASHGMMSL